MFAFDLLSSNVCFVKFIKKNGEERVMKCTKNLGMIPEEKHPHSNISYTPSQIRVFDLEKNAWRSFLVDSVISFEVI